MQEYMGLGSIAQEAIAYQGDAFFKELAIYYTQLKEAKTTGLDEHEAWEGIVKCVERKTGLKLIVDFSDGPAMQVPDVNKNNPLLDSIRSNAMSNKDGKKMVENAPNIVRGSVNLAKSTVSGIFTSMTHTLYMPLEIIKSNMTAEELSAITLHEVGHLFTYYECISRMVTTNQVLSGLARCYEETMTQAEREAVLIAAKKALKLKDMDIDSLSKTTNNKVAEIVIITSVQRQAKSEIGSDIYDMNNWEQLADLFAQRHGAGRALVTGLEKLMAGSNHMAFRSLPAYLLTEAAKLLLLAGSFAGLAIPAVGPVFFFYGSFWLIIWAIIDGAGSERYDRPRARFSRIRDQLVQRTKDKSISKEELQRYNDDIAVCDKIIGEMNSRLSVFSHIAKLIDSNHRKRMSAETLQQELESFANNEIFKQSALLRELA